jgi:hypothetical protein
MMTIDSQTIFAPGREARIAARSDVVVIGGGPAGFSAAIGAARNGASVTLVERYPYLGGLASGGMVLLLDDMCNGSEITIRGVCGELIERMKRYGLAVYPPEHEWGSSAEVQRKWARWGSFDPNSKLRPHPICYAAAFDPDGWKRASDDMVLEAGVNLRLHSWFSSTIVENGRATGVIVETKSGPEAIMGSVIVDTTGDLDVAASAGAPFTKGGYIVTTVFRLGGVNTEMAEDFQEQEPEKYQEVDREIRRMLGGAWEYWWLKTPLPGVVWCNCPHVAGLDGTNVEDLTKLEFESRKRIHDVVEQARQTLPGFEDCYIVDLAPQSGVRQTRLLDGEYVVSKEDISNRIAFHDSIARGRDYYTPYRALLPRNVDQLIVAGRHYSATSAAQKISREIPPCMAMGEAAGVAAALALESGVTVRNVDVPKLQARLRAGGADPGDQPSSNATLIKEQA